MEKVTGTYYPCCKRALLLTQRVATRGWWGGMPSRMGHPSRSVKKNHCTSSRLSSFKSSGQTVCKNTSCRRFHGLRYVSRGKTSFRFGSIRFSLVESDNRLPNNFIVLRRRRCCHRTVYSNPNHFIALCRHRAQSFHYMLSQNASILHIPIF